jgi:hypothetical protein
MKTLLTLILCLAGTMARAAQEEFIPYSSVTNLAMHVTNYHPPKIYLTLFPKVSTNTTEAYQPSELPFRGVSFSVQLSNLVFRIGSTNSVFCRLENNSTNDIMCSSYTFVGLTNSSVGIYEILPRAPRPKSDGGLINIFNPGRGLSFAEVIVSTTRKWSLSFKVNDDIQPGDYVLVASQGVITSDAKYSCEIRANPLVVRVVK